MPTVQRLTNPGITPTGASGARQNVSANADQMGGQLGNTMARVGGKIAKEAKDEADSLAVMEADSKMADWETAYLYDPQDGAMNTKGKASFELPEQSMESYKTIHGEIYKGLGNDAQREAFNKLSETRRRDVNRSVQRHVAGEYQTFETDTTKAALNNSVEAAAANWQDPERVSKEMLRQRTYIMSQAARNGQSGEVTKLQLDTATSTTHSAVIDQMLAGRDYARADAYYAANKDEIMGTKRDDIKDAINTGKVRGESQARADQLVRSGKSESQALADARKISDPEVRDATVRRVKSRYSEIDAAKKERTKMRLDSAVQTITNGGTIDDIPPATWNSFDRKTRTELRQLQSRGEWYQDDEKWYDFTQKDPEEIKNMNLYTEVRPYVDDAHWNRALALQKELNGNPNDPKLTSTLNYSRRFKNTIMGTIFEGEDKLDAEQKSIYGKMENEGSRRVQLEELDKGRKLLPNETQEVIDKLVLETVNIRELGRDPTVPIVGVKDDDRDDAYVPMGDIPTEDQESIYNLMLSNNRVPSKKKIENAYGAYMLGDKEAFNRIISE